MYDDTTVRTDMNQLSLLHTSIFLSYIDDNSIDVFEGFDTALLIILTANSVRMLGLGRGMIKYKGVVEG